MLALNKSFARRPVGVLVLIALLALAALLKYLYVRQGRLHLDGRTRMDSFKPFANRQIEGVDVRTYLDSRVALLLASDHFPPTNEFRNLFHADRGIAGVKGMGCAAAIDRRGYFLTAAHCLTAGEIRLIGLEFKTNGITVRTMTSRVIWRGDMGRGEPDLAILRVKQPLDRAFDLADDVRKNSPVMAVGMIKTNQTLDLTMEFMGGTILDCRQRTGKQGGAVVMTDLPIRPGDSGGPVLDAEGRLIGIDTRMEYPPSHWLLPGGFIGRAEHPDLKWVSDIIEKDFSGSQTNKD